METDKHKQKKEEELTPIIDGDARPDQNIEPDMSEDQKTKDKDLVSENRKGDVNSLEDYKDAR